MASRDIEHSTGWIHEQWGHRTVPQERSTTQNLAIKATIQCINTWFSFTHFALRLYICPLLPLVQVCCNNINLTLERLYRAKLSVTFNGLVLEFYMILTLFWLYHGGQCSRGKRYQNKMHICASNSYLPYL